MGSLKSSDLGLFDMHGNAYDWCQDVYKAFGKRTNGKAIEDMEEMSDIRNNNGRVLRGGSFSVIASNVRSAQRTAMCRRPATALTGFVRRGLYRLTALQLYQPPPEGVGSENGMNPDPCRLVRQVKKFAG